MTVLVGVIADTHGLLRPEALAALEGCQQILHAGDIGAPEILERLRQIAPVTAVRGNVDRQPCWAALPETEWLDIVGTQTYLLHDLHLLDLDPRAAGLQVVISGHSHQPKLFTDKSVVYLNPGSAGPRRFRLPVTLGLLEVSADAPPQARIIELL